MNGEIISWEGQSSFAEVSTGETQNSVWTCCLRHPVEMPWSLKTLWQKAPGPGLGFLSICQDSFSMVLKELFGKSWPATPAYAEPGSMVHSHPTINGSQSRPASVSNSCHTCDLVRNSTSWAHPRPTKSGTPEARPVPYV